MDSKQNPATPKFLSDLKNVTLDGYLIIKQTVKSSKLFTAGGKFDPLKTNPEFKALTSDLSEYVTTQIKEIIAAEIPKGVFTEQVEEPSYEDQLALSNNNILERVNSNLELLCNMAVLKKSNNDQNIPPLENPMYEPVVDAPEDPNEEWLPDIAGPPEVGNPNIWVPIIHEKPNSLVDLQFKLVYNVHGKAIGYENPYKVELEMYDSTPWTDAVNEPISFPAPLKNTNFKYVDTLATLEGLVRHLREVDEFAVDVEHHCHRSYIGLTCLIQITTYMGDYVIDAILLWPYLYKLNYSFTDPKKIKILHGAAMDVLWLQRDFGVYIVGLFDTYQAAKVLEHQNRSLKALLQHYCNVNVNKKYQCADWRVRPLSYAMLKYARTDTHYLLYIWKRMKNELLEKGKGEKIHLLQVFAASKKTCLATYKRRVVTYKSHINLYNRCNIDYEFRPYNFTVLKKLYKWRDDYAKELDESPSYVLPNMMMLALADKLPRDMKSMREICASGKKPLLRNLAQVLEIINVCLNNLPASVRLYVNRTSGEPTQHMLDMPNANASAETEEVVPETAGTSSESYESKAKTSNPTGRSEYRFCSPYLRYMKCIQVEKDLKKDKEMADVAGNSNTENVLEEFTPIFNDKETSEKEAEERAIENREEEEDAGEGTSDGFTLVTRRKRNARGKTVVYTPEGSLGVLPSTSSSQQASYQYSTRNYTSFNTPKENSNTKSLSKKRK